MADTYIIQVDLIAVRSHLSKIKGRIACEADAREFLARRGCLPAIKGWHASELTMAEMHEDWILERSNTPSLVSPGALMAAPRNFAGPHQR